jgi:hypothetical protein
MRGKLRCFEVGKECLHGWDASIGEVAQRNALPVQHRHRIYDATG